MSEITKPRYRNGTLPSDSGTSQDLLMKENDELVAQLEQKTSQLKAFSKEIHIEIKGSIDDVDKLHSDLIDTQGVLRSTMQKLNRLIESSSTRHMCYLAVFVVFIFLLIWFVISKFSRRGL